MKFSVCLIAALLTLLWVMPAGADWSRGETSMSRLPDEVKENLLNAEMDFSFALRHGVKPQDRKPVPKTDLPAYWNWHDMDGADWMTPVRNQGDCGSCWTFGSLGAMEALINIYKEDPDFDYDLSEQFMVACGGGSCEYGGASEEVLEYLRKNGIPDEFCYPYIEQEGVCEDACDDFLTRMVKLEEWSIMLSPTEEELKAEVMTGPIPVTMRVINDFFHYTGGVYMGFTEACSLVKLPPNHIVTLVGWNDEHNSWIARNSWGNDWGEDGYFEIVRGTSCFAVTTADWLRIDPDTLPEEPLNIGLCAPEVIEQTVEPGSTAKTAWPAFALENCGDMKIDWSIEEFITWKSWLSVAPAEGSLAPGESVNVQFTVNLENLLPGVTTQPFEVRTSNGPILKMQLQVNIQSEEPVVDGDEEIEEEATEDAPEDGDDNTEEDSGSGSDGCNSSGSPAALFIVLLGAVLLRRRNAGRI